MLDAYSDKLTGVVEDTWGGRSRQQVRFNLMYFA